MTRILTYNILVGGARRIDQITQMIRSAYPDVVGLIEASDPRVVETLGERLEMDYRMSGSPQHEADYGIALLSRLPIVSSHVHKRPGMNKPVLEVCVREQDGSELTIFVTHLSASFARSGRGGDSIRRWEVRQILRMMESKRGTPHLLMGDFNSIAPGDDLKGSRLLRYLIKMDRLHAQNPEEAAGHPHLNFVVPPSLRFLDPLLLQIPRSRLLSALFDRAVSLYTARGTLRLLRNAGYVDSFRRASPHSSGFTCPARAPSGRIDYIMASPELAGRLAACYVLTEGDGVFGYQASDHLPVLAEFGEAVGGVGRDAGEQELVADIR
jgi:endonuclease/exonuclease/phosphatase family metal-dependent hydrolase